MVCWQKINLWWQRYRRFSGGRSGRGDRYIYYGNSNNNRGRAAGAGYISDYDLNSSTTRYGGGDGSYKGGSSNDSSPKRYYDLSGWGFHSGGKGIDYSFTVRRRKQQYQQQ